MWLLIFCMPYGIIRMDLLFFWNRETWAGFAGAFGNAETHTAFLLTLICKTYSRIYYTCIFCNRFSSVMSRCMVWLFLTLLKFCLTILWTWRVAKSSSRTSLTPLIPSWTHYAILLSLTQVHDKLASNNIYMYCWESYNVLLSWQNKLYSSTAGVFFASAVLQRSFTLLSAIYTVTSSQTVTQTIVIDSTLGRNTVFVFDYTNDAITPSVTSPSGVVFDATSAIVTFDQTLRSYVFKIPDASFEVGSWRYSVETTVSNSITVAVSVTSMVGATQTATYNTNCFWTTSNVASLSPELPSLPQIVATVSLGKITTNFLLERYF